MVGATDTPAARERARVAYAEINEVIWNHRLGRATTAAAIATLAEIRENRGIEMPNAQIVGAPGGAPPAAAPELQRAYRVAFSCENCEGTGETHTGHKCPVCAGTGDQAGGVGAVTAATLPVKIEEQIRLALENIAEDYAQEAADEACPGGAHPNYDDAFEAAYRAIESAIRGYVGGR